MTTAFSLAGHTALVTGASRGIGEALAVGFAEAGADVVAAGRSTDRLAAVSERIRATGVSTLALSMDVQSTASIAAAFTAMDDAGLQASLLVNNAGIEQVSNSLDVDESLWARIVDTNLKGAFFVTQQFARRRLAANAPGAVVNVCSLSSGIGIPTATPYTASKSGLLGVTRALSSEWAPHGIRVNAIGPGYFRTALTEVFYQDAQWSDAMLGKIPAGRFGELDDLIGPSVFLCSDAARYVTGQLLYIDGGFMASI